MYGACGYTLAGAVASLSGMASIQCPNCGSYQTVRERGAWEPLWLLLAAASFVMRFLLTFARYGEYRGEPGVYRCVTCGRSFAFFI